MTRAHRPKDQKKTICLEHADWLFFVQQRKHLKLGDGMVMKLVMIVMAVMAVTVVMVVVVLTRARPVFQGFLYFFKMPF